VINAQAFTYIRYVCNERDRSVDSVITSMVDAISFHEQLKTTCNKFKVLVVFSSHCLYSLGEVVAGLIQQEHAETGVGH